MNYKRRILIPVLAFILALTTGCGMIRRKENDPDQNNPVATMEIQDKGTVKIELYPDIAPNTVNNFISLANSGYYNGLKFHRIIDGFMIQGGDPNGDGTGGPGYSIKGEFTNNGFENNLRHEKGVISMARTRYNYDSAGSQFFIMVSDQPGLDGDYAAFGKVIGGMDIVMDISKVKTDYNDAPLNDVVVKSLSVDTCGKEYPEPERIEE